MIETDLVISVGSFCRTAQALKRNELRKMSSPFDWMMEYRLSAIADFFECGFDSFFKERMDTNKVHDGHRVVKDIRTGMVSIHDFPDNVNMEEYYPLFFEKHKKRFRKMMLAVNSSECITFVSCSREQERAEIIVFLKRVNLIWGKSKKIVFINIINSKNEKLIKKRICANCTLFEVSFDDSYIGNDSSQSWMGNVQKWDELLSCVHLNSKSDNTK